MAGRLVEGSLVDFVKGGELHQRRKTSPARHKKEGGGQERSKRMEKGRRDDHVLRAEQPHLLASRKKKGKNHLKKDDGLDTAASPG